MVKTQTFKINSMYCKMKREIRGIVESITDMAPLQKTSKSYGFSSKLTIVENFQ